LPWQLLVFRVKIGQPNSPGELRDLVERDSMALRGLLARDEGSVAVEYVVFVAAVGIILIVGVAALFNAMSKLFTYWGGPTGYFASTS